MSLGTPYLWSGWLFASLAIEMGTSALTHRMYVEFALSLYQMVPFAFGSYLVDRVFMMIEPENYYLPRSKNYLSQDQKIIDIAPTTPNVQQISESTSNDITQNTPTPERTPKSWLFTKFQNLVKNVARTPRATIDNIGQSLKKQRIERERRHAESLVDQEERVRTAKEERDSRLNDMGGRF